MKKNCILFLLSFLLIFSGYAAAADDYNEDEPFTDTFNNVSVDLKAGPPKIDAQAGIVMDYFSARVLYEKNAYIERPMASTTKVMTAIVALERGNLSDEVTVSKHAASVSGSTIHLRTGDRLTLETLLYGLMLNSGNDAAIAIAEHIGGSEEGFVAMMNKKAAQIGADNTHFVTPYGLDRDGHYSTPYDLALMTRYALNNPVFNKIVSTKQITIDDRNFHSSNEMLSIYSGADGVKTGYTGKAGRCLITSATRDNERFISVVLNSPTRSARALSSKKVLDYAFGTYKTVTLIGSDTFINTLPLKDGISKNVIVGTREKVSLPLKEDEISLIDTKIDLPEMIFAPVYDGMAVGVMEFLMDGKVIASCTIEVKEDVRLKLYWDYVLDFLYCV